VALALPVVVGEVVVELLILEMAEEAAITAQSQHLVAVVVLPQQLSLTQAKEWMKWNSLIAFPVNLLGL
jgi:hypothetical protein